MMWLQGLSCAQSFEDVKYHVFVILEVLSTPLRAFWPLNEHRHAALPSAHMIEQQKVAVLLQGSI